MERKNNLGDSLTPIAIAVLLFLVGLPEIKVGGSLAIPVKGLLKYVVILFFGIGIIKSYWFDLKMLLTKRELKGLFYSKVLLPYYLLFIWAVVGHHFVEFFIFAVVFIYLSIVGYTSLSNYFKKIWQEQLKMDEKEERLKIKRKEAKDKR